MRKRCQANRQNAVFAKAAIAGDADGAAKAAGRQQSRRNRPQTGLRARALALLARREHTRQELARKLAPHAESAAALEALLAELAAGGLLSEERYAEMRAFVLGRKYGSARIAHELRAQGVPDEVIEAAVAQAKAGDLERARAIWRRKFGVVAASREMRARQARFLQSRGFSSEVIRKVIAGPDGDD
ncbi:MAG: recombination regulator RecX [Burkholderiales bacterium]